MPEKRRGTPPAQPEPARKSRPRRTAAARALRRRATEPERLLWYHLRDRRLNGFKFVRQAPIDAYIVDFLCREHRLVVELDGGGHAESRSDPVRDARLAALGYRTLRFWNGPVRTELPAVLDTIWHALADPRFDAGVAAARTRPGASAEQAARPLTPALSPASGGEGDAPAGPSGASHCHSGSTGSSPHPDSDVSLRYPAESSRFSAEDRKISHHRRTGELPNKGESERDTVAHSLLPGGEKVPDAKRPADEGPPQTHDSPVEKPGDKRRGAPQARAGRDAAPPRPPPPR